MTSQDILAGGPVMFTLPSLLNIHHGGIWEGELPQAGLNLLLANSHEGSWAGWKAPKVILREVPKPAREMGVQAPHTREGKWGLGPC